MLKFEKCKNLTKSKSIKKVSSRPLSNIRNNNNDIYTSGKIKASSTCPACSAGGALA
jgi:hypothetical protein